MTYPHDCGNPHDSPLIMLAGTGPSDFFCENEEGMPEIDREELGMENTNNVREYPDYNILQPYNHI